jgi:hypothetical protein
MSSYKPKHKRSHPQFSPEKNYRQTMDAPSSNRISFANNYLPSVSYRESISQPSYRNTMNIEYAHSLRKDLYDYNSNPKPVSNVMGNLKNTLSMLQGKVNKAKKQLIKQNNIVRNIISEQDESDE